MTEPNKEIKKNKNEKIKDDVVKEYIAENNTCLVEENEEEEVNIVPDTDAINLLEDIKKKEVKIKNKDLEMRLKIIEGGTKAEVIQDYNKIVKELDIDEPLKKSHLSQMKKGDIFDLIAEMLTEHEEDTEDMEDEDDREHVSDRFVEVFYRLNVVGSFCAETLAGETIFKKTNKDIRGFHEDLLDPKVKKNMLPVIRDMIEENPEKYKRYITPVNTYACYMGSLLINRIKENGGKGKKK